VLVVTGAVVVDRLVEPSVCCVDVGDVGGAGVEGAVVSGVTIDADDCPAGGVVPSSEHAVTATSATNAARQRTGGVRRLIG
jgi:hypothetical protein